MDINTTKNNNSQHNSSAATTFFRPIWKEISWFSPIDDPYISSKKTKKKKEISRHAMTNCISNDRENATAHTKITIESQSFNHHSFQYHHKHKKDTVSNG